MIDLKHGYHQMPLAQESRACHPERKQLEVAALDTEPTGPANQEYGVMPEVASRVVADPGCVLFRNLRPSAGL